MAKKKKLVIPVCTIRGDYGQHEKGHQYPPASDGQHQFPVVIYVIEFWRIGSIRAYYNQEAAFQDFAYYEQQGTSVYFRKVICGQVHDVIHVINKEWNFLGGQVELLG